MAASCEALKLKVGIPPGPVSVAVLIADSGLHKTPNCAPSLVFASSFL